jgi:DNA polymerase-3 subunit epsilon
MKNLVLTRPLLCFDLETTGVNPRQDRIVELAAIRLLPDGSRTDHEFRFNPGMPIPAAATAIHGIRDEDVADCPTFVALAPQLHALFQDCDLAGFGIVRFDLIMLTEEFARAGMPFQDAGRRLFDAQSIFHRREPRNLAAALAYYCGLPHPKAHSALADAEAALQVLDAQFDKYPDLPRDPDQLDRYCRPPRDTAWADRSGRLKWVAGELTINFGTQYLGRKVRDLVQTNPKFLKWILTGDFPFDTKQLVYDALEGRFPHPPAASDETA